MTVKHREEIETIEAMIKDVLKDSTMSLAQYKALTAAERLLEGSVKDGILDCSDGFSAAKTIASAMIQTNDNYWNMPFDTGYKYFGNRKPLSEDDWAGMIRSQDEANLNKAYMDTFSRPSIERYL